MYIQVGFFKKPRLGVSHFTWRRPKKKQIKQQEKNKTKQNNNKKKKKKKKKRNVRKMRCELSSTGL